MSLYFILLILSFIVPFSLSFEKNLRFYKKWKFLLPAIGITAAIYIFFDVIFTEKGIWGFNQEYLSGIYIFNLPVEECLFFVIIPYSSLFLHSAIQFHFPKIKLGKIANNLITLLLILICLYLVIFHTNKQYTFYISIKLGVALILLRLIKSEITKTFFPSFLVILIPFLIVNGILTGSFIENEIVWYNNAENLSIRAFTIPVEDFAYALSMLLYNLLFLNFFLPKNERT